MPIFVLFVSAGVSFDGFFALRVSLKTAMTVSVESLKTLIIFKDKSRDMEITNHMMSYMPKKLY